MRIYRVIASVVLALALGGCSSISPVVTGEPIQSATPPPTVYPTAAVALQTYVAPTGFSLEYPADWRTVNFQEITRTGGSIHAILANYPISGCGGPADINCVLAAPVPPGGIQLHIGSNRGLDSVFDPSMQWTETIDKMPANLTFGPGYTGVDELRSWVIARPDEVHASVSVEGVLRGPGLPALEAKFDAAARSIRFASHPPQLDPAKAATALSTGLESFVQRNDAAAFYACFPRTPGDHRVTLEAWWAEVLSPPVPVTCTTALEATAVNLWRIALSVSWDAGADHAAGVWRQNIYVDAKGTYVGDDQLTPSVAPVKGFDQPPASSPSPGG
jgi:hypothetical protein